MQNMFCYRYRYTYLLVVLTIVGTYNAQIIPLASYCHQVNESCNCEPQSNLVRAHCPNEYAMIMQVTDNGIKISLSYYSTSGVRWLPRFDFSQVAMFEFDAYNYWSETFFKDLLDALGVQEVLQVQFRDRSLETEVSVQGEEELEDLEGEAAVSTNISSWIFSPVPALEYFKYESFQLVLPETIFQAFDSLKTLELKLAVRRLPNKLFSSVSNSLQTLSISNPHMFHFRPELLQELQQLRNLSLRLQQSGGGEKPDKLRNHVFTSMPELEELRLSRATNRVEAKMFKGSYKLRFIQLNKNPQLSELPSELFLDQGNLTTLDLSCNALSKLPVDLLISQSNLRLLDLSSNRLTNLSSEMFKPLTSLRKLILNRNALTSLNPTTFESVQSLNFIDMRGTQFYGTKLKMPFEALVCTNEDTCQYKSDHWECDPHCICYVQRLQWLLYVDCRGAELESLPALPRTTLVSTVLKLKNNSISELPADASQVMGFTNVSLLNLADNQLSSLDAARQLPDNLSMLDVRRNQISVFDQSFINYLLNNTMSVMLSGNPMSCDCNALPLLGFVRAQPQRVPDIGDIYCPSWPTKPFQQLEVWDLCPSYVLLIACIVGCLIIVACLISVVYLIYQQELKIWLYNHNLCLWWVSEEELDKDKTYDAFISYSHKDEQLIAELLPKLENGLHAFRVCLHGRDWLVGDCIPEQIVRTVNDSKRVIIVLSQHFIDSVWARMEFRIAYQATLQDKRKRIIIILYKELEHFEGIDSELRAYLKLNTYLKWGDPLFWSKLHYAMPHNRRVLKGQKKHAGPLI